jgi:hypothetical protein
MCISVKNRRRKSMKLFLTLTILLSTLGNAAPAPFLPEVHDRFLQLENTFTVSGSGIYPMKSAILEINYSEIAAASNVTYKWGIPANALIVNCFYEVTETFTSSSDAATIGFQIEDGNDIVAASAISTGTGWDATGLPVLGVPDFATVADAVKLTSPVKDLVVVRGGAEVLTAGNVILYCQYFEGK